MPHTQYNYALSLKHASMYINLQVHAVETNLINAYLHKHRWGWSWNQVDLNASDCFILYVGEVYHTPSLPPLTVQFHLNTLASRRVGVYCEFTGEFKLRTKKAVTSTRFSKCILNTHENLSRTHRLSANFICMIPRNIHSQLQ